MEQKFFVCKQCGNIIGIVYASGVPMECCGEEMTELVPGTSDGAAEKHVPVISVDGTTVTVTVGSAAHPMIEAHHIEWISLHTKEGNQRKSLSPTGEPKVTFAITADDEVQCAYAYCNLHKLWKAEI
jgi:Desulfoferrodoxin